MLEYKTLKKGIIMIKSYDKLSKELKEEICRKFEANYDFEALKKLYPEIDHITLYSILNAAGKYHDKIYPSLPQIDISEKKIIFMSDTQFGSKYENLSYTYDLFDFAIKNGYHIVLHGGDIIEGNINRRRNMSSIRQAHYFVDKFPHDDSITTHALYGNHDFLAMQRNEDVRAVLESREDVNMLGFKKAYIRWNGNTISLQHDIDNYKISMYLLPEKIEDSYTINYSSHEGIEETITIVAENGKWYISSSGEMEITSNLSYVSKEAINDGSIYRVKFSDLNDYFTLYKALGGEL